MRQRTEVVDDASWVMGFLDIIDPAIDSIKRLLKLDRESFNKEKNPLENIPESNGSSVDEDSDGKDKERSGTGIDLDAFIREKLSLDPTKLDFRLEPSKAFLAKRTRPPARRPWRPENKIAPVSAHSSVQ